MNRTCLLTAPILAVCLMTVGACAVPGVESPAALTRSANDSSAPATPWPRTITSGGSTMTLYQPELDRWQANQLAGRVAVAVRTGASPAPTYGLVSFTARTEIDKPSGTVTFEDFEITQSGLPVAGYAELIRQDLASAARMMPLEQLQADVTVTQAEQRQEKQPLRNVPPRIIYSSAPAILVLVDGQAALRQVSGTDLLRVINTRALLVLDQRSGTYYLYVADGWMQATSLEGPWIRTTNPPVSLDTAKQAATASGQVDLLDDSSPEVAVALSEGIAPSVDVSTTPTELLQTEGPPDLQPIDGTHLLWVKNSTSSIFLDVPSQDYYVLLSGRWFRSKSLANGPWTYVPGADLPKDFTRIPATHPAGDALPSVPETPQAKQARIAHDVPQTATVRRDTARLSVSYDGAPQFKPIEGTALQYAVNTRTAVIRVDPTTYYACESGVWFGANSAIGPWTVAASVPSSIYTIPVSSPVHYVTNVYVYGATPEYVYTGYTPGYLGTYLEPDGTVVFGSGYVYPSWIGTAWFGAPITYGLGAAFDWDVDLGWGWAFGWGIGPVWRPWWGPWWGHRWQHGGWPRPWRAVNINRFNVYNHWDRHGVINGHRFGPARPGPFVGAPRGAHPGGVPDHGFAGFGRRGGGFGGRPGGGPAGGFHGGLGGGFGGGHGGGHR